MIFVLRRLEFGPIFDWGWFCDFFYTLKFQLNQAISATLSPSRALLSWNVAFKGLRTPWVLQEKFRYEVLPLSASDRCRTMGRTMKGRIRQFRGFRAPHKWSQVRAKIFPFKFDIQCSCSIPLTFPDGSFHIAISTQTPLQLLLLWDQTKNIKFARHVRFAVRHVQFTICLSKQPPIA